jgi:DNA end-binding protein Ku
LYFDYEVRSAKEAFDGIPEIKISGEMLDLAKHIITTKRGKFDPGKFEDRYEAALAELVRAKLEGREIEVRKAPTPEKVLDLMEALRKSAAAGRTEGSGGKGRLSDSKRKASTETSRRRKAG